MSKFYPQILSTEDSDSDLIESRSPEAKKLASFYVYDRQLT